MDADGTNARQLTYGSLDVHPDFAADGRSVVYGSFVDWSPAVGGEPTLWSVPIDGGKAQQISQQPTSFPVVSSDGKRLGCIYFPGKDPRFSAARVATLALDGTGVFTIFQASPSRAMKRRSPGARTAQVSTTLRIQAEPAISGDSPSAADHLLN